LIALEVAGSTLIEEQDILILFIKNQGKLSIKIQNFEKQVKP
jgi:hypothetical protein